MSKIALDLKKFKHIESDKDHTVLEHEDGHVLHMSHKSLSPEFQKQLASLCNHEDKEVSDKPNYDEGGLVDKAKKFYHDQARKGTFGATVEATEKYDNPSDEIPKAIPSYRPAQSVKNYAEGDLVTSPEDDSVRSENPNYIPPMQAEPMVEAPIEAKPESNPYADTYYKMYNQIKVLEPALPDSAIRQQAMRIAESKKSADVADKKNLVEDEQIAKSNVIMENAQRVQLGLLPLPVPQQATADGAPPIPQPAAPDQGLAQVNQAQQTVQQEQPGVVSPEDMITSGFNEKLGGINKAADAQGALGTAQAKLLSDQVKAQQIAADEYKKSFSALDTERQHLQDDIKDGHVNPDLFWKDHSKIATGIGMILAGFNPTNSPNAAVNFLKFQMEQDLSAQKENLQSKQNLLRANLQQFGNLRDAETMTRLMQNDMLVNKLQSAAATAQNPMAKAAAMQAVGQLKMEAAPMFQQLAARRTMAGLEAQSKADPSKIDAYLAALDVADPKKAKEMRGRLIPGVGFANTYEDAKDMKTMGSGVQEAKIGINTLMDISKKPFKSLSLADRAKADTIRQTLVGALRLPITGPGAMNEGERELLQKVIADPTAVFSLDSNNKVRLKTLADSLDNKFSAALKARGLTPLQPQQPQQELVKGKDGKMYRREGNFMVPVK